jgi:hypothetical protein
MLKAFYALDNTAQAPLGVLVEDIGLGVITSHDRRLLQECV